MTAPSTMLPVKLTGLSKAHEKTCNAALQAFLRRHRLTSWGLDVSLDGARQLDVSSIAPPEFDAQVRSTRLTVDRMVDLEQVVDMCLETHYNSCMNFKAQQGHPKTGRKVQLIDAERERRLAMTAK